MPEEGGSHSRKINGSSLFNAITTPSLPIEGGLASPWPGVAHPWEPKPKKTSGLLSLALICYHARRRSRDYASRARLFTQLRPAAGVASSGFALPGPLRRPADPNSPGWIANPSSNRSVMGMFRSAGNLINGFLVTKPMTQKPPHSTAGVLYGKASIGISRADGTFEPVNPSGSPIRPACRKRTGCIVRGYNACDTAADNV